MNRIFILVVFCLLGAISLPGQNNSNDDCAVEATPDPYFDREDYDQFRHNLLGRKNNFDPTIRIPVIFQIVGNAQGEGGLDRADIPEIMDSLNIRFVDYNIQFFQCREPIEVYEDNFFDFDPSRFSASMNRRNIPDVLNIYFVNRVLNEDELLCGYARFPWTDEEYVVVANSCALDGSTLSHGIGHFLGLWHTHETISGVELADGSNCKYEGDEICDTPADPRLSTQNVDSSCNYTGNERDSNDDPYEPDPTNIMSYSRTACRTNFTDEQIIRMKYYLRRDYGDLVCNNLTSTEEEGYLEELRVFPNPARETLQLRLNCLQAQDVNVQLFDALGKIHQETHWELITGENQLTLQVEGQAAGVYFLILSGNLKKSYKKVIIR